MGLLMERELQYLKDELANPDLHAVSTQPIILVGLRS
jgi:hypothetical protein